MSDKDIAARFGVSVAVVRQRLKLARVSPKLIALYRKGDMPLDCLMAFAISDDHKQQEKIWKDLPAWSKGDADSAGWITDPALLHRLTEHGYARQPYLTARPT